MTSLRPAPCATLGVLLAAAVGSAQPPSTDIYLARLIRSSERLEIGTPVNITSRAGYDNQPRFDPAGDALLYTSIREDGQADIYRYDIVTGVSARLTRTTESEYSPMITPAGDAFTVVRVEADSTQRLWRFDLAGEPAGVVFPRIAPVGYYAWCDTGTVALFVLGPPARLVLAETGGGAADTIAESIGRSLHSVPSRAALSYVDKSREDEWWVMELDLATLTPRRLARTPRGSEDFAWTPEGSLLMGSGAKLFARRPDEDADWQEVADLHELGIEVITRLAVSPGGDRLAIVAR